MDERSDERPDFPEPPDGLLTAPEHRVLALLDTPDEAMGHEREVLLRSGHLEPLGP